MNHAIERKGIRLNIPAPRLTSYAYPSKLDSLHAREFIHSLVSLSYTCLNLSNAFTYILPEFRQHLPCNYTNPENVARPQINNNKPENSTRPNYEQQY